MPASRLSWVALHGGELHDSQVAAAYAKCRPVTAAQMSLAVTVWRAFRQPKPADIMKLTRQLPKLIPGLKESLLRLLQEYPSQRNGLSRLEKLLLMTIRSKGSITAATAASAIFSKETVGDLLLFDMLRDFVRASHPLLEFAEPFSGNIGNRHFHSAVLRLTGFGKRVLAGKADHVTANGIDRWIGGVHLRGQSVRWRWDTIEKRIVSTD
ncbi:MAG TPA: hypothetical protein VKV39_08635 [Candidatus Sulfotelmatobacter sp.]|nr:hypothetical protein [Candidatus Sulfotelmatobacter sp.]